MCSLYLIAWFTLLSFIWMTFADSIIFSSCALMAAHTCVLYSLIGYVIGTIDSSHTTFYVHKPSIFFYLFIWSHNEIFFDRKITLSSETKSLVREYTTFISMYNNCILWYCQYRAGMIQCVFKGYYFQTNMKNTKLHTISFVSPNFKIEKDWLKGRLHTHQISLFKVKREKQTLIFCLLKATKNCCVLYI